jgi:glutamyl-tRNA synthetase
LDLILPRLERALARTLDETERARLRAALPGLKPRAKTLVELADQARFYVEQRPLPLDERAQSALTAEARSLIAALVAHLAKLAWQAPVLEEAVRAFAEQREVKLGAVAQPLRAALVGTLASPPIFEVMAVLGRKETLARLADVAPAQSAV